MEGDSNMGGKEGQSRNVYVYLRKYTFTTIYRKERKKHPYLDKAFALGRIFTMYIIVDAIFAVRGML